MREKTDGREEKRERCLDTEAVCQMRWSEGRAVRSACMIYFQLDKRLAMVLI